MQRKWTSTEELGMMAFHRQRIVNATVLQTWMTSFVNLCYDRMFNHLIHITLRIIQFDLSAWKKKEKEEEKEEEEEKKEEKFLS